MLDNLIRDEPLVAAVRNTFSNFRGYLAAAGELMMAGRGLRGKARERCGAAIALALSFEAWRTLCREGGLSDDEGARLMAGLVEASVT
jgi:hypothetical protein